MVAANFGYGGNQFTNGTTSITGERSRQDIAAPWPDVLAALYSLFQANFERSQPATRIVPRRHRSSWQFVLCLYWVSLLLALSTSALEHSCQHTSSCRWLERRPRIIRADTRRLDTPLPKPVGASIVFKDVELICVYLPPSFPTALYR
jgi:hypothetical protein